MQSTFQTFFQVATGYQPYLWQCRLACGKPPQGANCNLTNPDELTIQWLSGGNQCFSQLIDIPTGHGKTAGVIMAWLWNWCLSTKDSHWPRRLVYCLPMRTLVEQTAEEAKKWIANVAQAASLCSNPEDVAQAASLCSSPEDVAQAASLCSSPEDHSQAGCATIKRPRVIILMGGEDVNYRDWDLYPEDPAILIGTQDMLLSRALNRGYGMSRYRWPMHFALLNHDALWVMDEVQLMGAGLACTTQLEGFRSTGSGPAPLGTQSWWMSATIRPDWLKTVDFPSTLADCSPLTLTEKERKDGARVESLRTAPKQLIKASSTGKECNPKEVATYIATNRSSDHLNLVVVNTVKRARLLHAELAKQLGRNQSAPILLHSQFRAGDRQRVLASIREGVPGRIVISTQVIEAGVDLSAHTLFTELAPWSSLVQRFGRCNRWLVDDRPHFEAAQIHWFDLDESKQSAPYDEARLIAARNLLEGMQSASIAKLEQVVSPDADRPVFRHVLRRKDLVDLFDTTPDLTGADLDIDRFVRDADSSNVQVFWRAWGSKTPNGDASASTSPEPAPRREELCSTGIGDLKALIDKQSQSGSAWRWNYLDREWQSIKSDALVPGQIYLLHSDTGGYDSGVNDQLPLGWTGDSKSIVTSISPIAGEEAPEANEDDRASEASTWQTVAQHTDVVCKELDALLYALDKSLHGLCPNIPILESLRHAARWHDWGKAHAAFQAKLTTEPLAKARQLGELPTTSEAESIAKAPEGAWSKGRLPTRPVYEDPRRKHFRHELASALGILHPASGFPLTERTARDLAAYLIAAHHGKIRLSIRSLPDEWIPPLDPEHPTERRFARGIWEGDTLPDCNLGGGVYAPTLQLSLEPMELGLCESDPFLGQPSWLERTLDLRDSFGPFLLAYLEALLRAADGRASKITPADNP